MASSACAARFRPPHGRWMTWWQACATNWRNLEDDHGRRRSSHDGTTRAVGPARAEQGGEPHRASQGGARGTRRDGIARGARARAGEQSKAENPAALLKAARAVFAEMGYGAASVRDIVRRTDLASGTFYNYFKDKDRSEEHTSELQS